MYVVADLMQAMVTKPHGISTLSGLILYLTINIVPESCKSCESTARTSMHYNTHDPVSASQYVMHDTACPDVMPEQTRLP